MTVPAGDLHTESTELVNPNAPVVLLTADKTRGKSPLNIQFNASNSFDRNDLDLSFNWNFGGIATSIATDTTFTFTEVGEYNVLLTVTNTDGLSSTDSLKITVLPNGTAYGGTPRIIPTTIEAEHDDEGGEGIAYHDTDANNQFYRPGEGVDLGADGGSVHVLFIIASEWIEYTFEVAEAGNYKFIPYMATVPGFGNFTMLIDNEDVSGKIRVNGTGSFINFQPFEIKPTYLESAQWKSVLEEDIFVVEGMQRGRHGPGFDGGRFSPAMDAPTHCFHAWVAKTLTEAQNEPAQHSPASAFAPAP